MVKELEDRGLVTKTAVDGKNYCSLIRLTEEGSGVAEQVNERYFERICGLIDKRKVRFGGRVNAAEQQIEPTVMDNVTWNDAVMQGGIFCPVLLILIYDNFEDIFAMRYQPYKSIHTRAFIINSFICFWDDCKKTSCG